MARGRASKNYSEDFHLLLPFTVLLPFQASHSCTWISCFQYLLEPSRIFLLASIPLLATFSQIISYIVWDHSIRAYCDCVGAICVLSSRVCAANKARITMYTLDALVELS